MKISEVNISFVKSRNGLIGFASIVLNNSIFLSSIGIYEKLQGGYRITYPAKGEHKVFYPINRETSDLIEKTIFNKLKEVMKKVNNDRYNSDNAKQRRF
ncbi:MAG: hypothetical protein ACTSXL_02370 [Alphaproteobacteria bacterium]